MALLSFSNMLVYYRKIETSSGVVPFLSPGPSLEELKKTKTRLPKSEGKTYTFFLSVAKGRTLHTKKGGLGGGEGKASPWLVPPKQR